MVVKHCQAGMVRLNCPAGSMMNCKKQTAKSKNSADATVEAHILCASEGGILPPSRCRPGAGRTLHWQAGSPPPQIPWQWALALWLLLLLCLCGCAGPRLASPANCRYFDFQKDSFAYANELKWEYCYDTNGQWTTHAREPKATYSLHCFVVSRSARQFFDNARFDPQQPVADEATYRRLIHSVIASNPRKPLAEARKIVIPGYADLRSFSQAQEKQLKAECGGAWQSYFQRGNWRMILPFSRHQQERVAGQLLAHLKSNRPLIVHLVRFPQLTINHAVVIFDARETDKEIQFTAYDPNEPAKPATITYDRATRTFLLPANAYFPGGRVDVYEIFWRWNY